MAGRISNDNRDQLISLFRERICQRLNIAPFLHQRQVWAAMDGLELTGELTEDPTKGLSVRIDKDGSILYALYKPRVIEVIDPKQVAEFGAIYTGPARFLSDLGAFKIGKSYGAGIIGASFGIVPGAKVSLVGWEYDICSPEFNYIAEFLLSEAGMGMKYKSFINNPRQGDMYLELTNGAIFECRSWARKDSLKGKENDAYIYCEAYQLPGIECFTSFSQNLKIRRGYAYFATTPDKPWIKLLHELGHGADPEWHCTCSVPAEANPFAFDPRAKARDVKLMTKEKFEIHYNGQLGDFVGRVFNYTIGSRLFDDKSHPECFRAGPGTLRDRLRLPEGWTAECGADTGTFYCAVIVFFDPGGNAYVVDEFPNYRYIGGESERDESLSIPQWANGVYRRCQALGVRPNFWADPNSQFKGELRNYGLTLLPARAPVETRTEILREYFEHNRIFLAPWITQAIPFELENASWPEEASLSGKFARLKLNDHAIDPIEHIIARRPFGRRPLAAKKYRNWAESVGYKSLVGKGNIHLGRR